MRRLEVIDSVLVDHVVTVSREKDERGGGVPHFSGFKCRQSILQSDIVFSKMSFTGLIGVLRVIDGTQIEDGEDAWTTQFRDANRPSLSIVQRPGVILCNPGYFRIGGNPTAYRSMIPTPAQGGLLSGGGTPVRASGDGCRAARYSESWNVPRIPCRVSLVTQQATMSYEV